MHRFITALVVLVAIRCLSGMSSEAAVPVATLISPAGPGIEATPIYTWNAVPGATWYELWVADTTQYQKLDIWYTAAGVGCAGGGTCTVAPSVPLAPGAATWWIQWWGPGGYGSWSAGMPFTVSLPSTMATLVSPSGTITDSTPTYTWNAVPGMTWYYLWVQDTLGAKVQQWMTAATAGCGSGTGTCSYTPTTAIAPGIATWWIQVWSPAGYGPWSNGMSFTVSIVPTCADIAGTWSGVATDGLDSLNISLSLSQTNCSITGTLYSPDSCPGLCGMTHGPVTGSVSGNTFTLVVPSDPTVDCDTCNVLCYGTDQGTLDVSGNTMSGSVLLEDCEAGGYSSVTVSLTRSGAAPLASALGTAAGKRAGQKCSLLRVQR